MFKSILTDELLHPDAGEEREVEMQKYNLEHISRLNFPITLNPETATIDDIAVHGRLRQGLKETTVGKHIAYANYVMNHPCPANPLNPNYEEFVRHLDYRREIENASPNALRHEKKMMNMFLRAYGQPLWEIKLPPSPKNKVRILPFPDIVHKFFNYEYTDNKDENTLFQYIFYHGFTIGPRTPSEMVEWTTDDIILNDDGTGYLIITETKKAKSERTIVPEKEILSDYRHKSFKNWIDIWRPKFETQYSKNHLYIQPETGKPFSSAHLGHKLSKYGKQIWPHFQPYDIRHWCAVARLIETKINAKSFEPFTVKEWLGHEKLQTTMSYLRYATQYYKQAPYDWIKRVLKFHKMEGENTLRSCLEKSINDQKTLVSSGNPSRSEYGPGQICTSQQEKNLSIKTKNEWLSKFNHFYKNSLISFFFRFIKNCIHGAGSCIMHPFVYKSSSISTSHTHGDCKDGEKADKPNFECIPSSASIFFTPKHKSVSPSCITTSTMNGMGFDKILFLKKKYLSSPPSFLSHSLLLTSITYKHVCHKLYKGLNKARRVTATIEKSMYVRLCYVISYLSIYLYSLLTNSYYINFPTYHTVCYVICSHHKKDCFLTNFEV